MQLFILDAFADQPFGGNPAGVVLLDGGVWPDERAMRLLAAELRHSETAFVRRESPDRFALRYFTPACEVDLCGHATLAAFSALRREGLVSPGRPVTAETNAGELTVELDENLVWLTMSPSRVERLLTEEEARLARNAVGLDFADGLRPAIVSTGLRDLMLPVPSRDELNKLIPDMDRVAALSRAWHMTGFHLFAPGGFCRNLAPLVGIPEEAATGTSSASLIHYLWTLGHVVPGQCVTLCQGEAMGRTAHIHARLDGQSPGRVRIGGRAQLICRGTLDPAVLFGKT